MVRPMSTQKRVDEDRRPGRFLLTGSANSMALPTVADSLAGRKRWRPTGRAGDQGSRLSQSGNLRGLKRLASIADDKFKMGVVLYDGAQTPPLGDRLWAAPISTLWGR